MLLHPLDQILGTTTKVQILRALFPLRDAVSGREVKRLAGVTSRSALSRALEQLSDLGILHQRGTVGVHLYQVNAEHHLAPVLESLFQAERASFDVLRTAVRSALLEAEVEESVVSVVVFGSVARSDARPDSDLDLLIVTVEDDQGDAVVEALLDRAGGIRSRLGVRVSPLALSRARLRERFREGDPLLANVLDEGRTLLGASFRETLGAR